MRNCSLLTKRETSWLNFGHVTRAGAEDPASDRLSIPARFRLEPSWTRGRDSAQRYKYRAGLEPGRGSRNDVASTSTIDGPTSFPAQPTDLSSLLVRRACDVHRICHSSGHSVGMAWPGSWARLPPLKSDLPIAHST